MPASLVETEGRPGWPAFLPHNETSAAAPIGLRQTLIAMESHEKNRRRYNALPARLDGKPPPCRRCSAVRHGTRRFDDREIDASTGFVIELGPGTGAFTRALLARGVPEKNLTLVEVGSNFAAMLGLRFPKASILCVDAADLTAVDYWRNGKVGAVVSGLPLLSMPTAKIIAIMAGAFSHLRDDGAFYQFTYGPRCPVPAAILDQLGLGATHIGRTLWNIPPAAVYRISRKSR